MKKRGPPSAEDLKIIPFAPAADRLQPPDDLSAKERAIFRQAVMSCPSMQFSQSDVFLLSSFARITLIVERAARDLNKARSPRDRMARMRTLDQAIRSQCLVATKLRLTVTGRHDSRTLARHHASHRPLSYYETMDDDDDGSRSA